MSSAAAVGDRGGTMPASATNPDLLKERQGATFDSLQMTYFLFNGPEKVRRRRFLRNLAFSDPNIRRKPYTYMSRDEAYTEGMRKAVYLVNRVKELNLTDPMDAAVFREASGAHEGSPLGLHLGMFLPTIESMGTKEQLEYWLPKCYNYEVIGTYAQTELGHGKDRLFNDLADDLERDGLLFTADQLYHFQNMVNAMWYLNGNKQKIQDRAKQSGVHPVPDRYDPGGAAGVTVFLWKVPNLRDSTEMMTSASRIVKSLESRLPEYHTRRMRREFAQTYGNMAGEKIPPHILRALYTDLGLDATADQNQAITLRMEKSVLGEDPDLITDLRHLNKGRPGDTFAVFFDELAKKVEDLKAADERRHGIEHISKYISIPDLIRDVTASCPPNTPIPSESTVLFAFAPRNSHARVAKLYKQRVDLKFKLQTRQLRSSHVDEHYCAAIFKYMKSHAVRYRDGCIMLCVDDKSKMDYGEPGLAISSGVRGRRSIVASGSDLSALDHDVNSKGSLTPSVCLAVDIPEHVADSFYRGQVTVTLKDSVFQASSPFRHAAEMIRMLKMEMDTVPPVLLIYSDGGPDHRVNYGSVKIAMIAMFKELDLDLLVAARTAPGHSWANPAERIMSILNLAYQNLALTREECSSELEQVIRSLNSMEDIRKKAKTVPGLKPAWISSTEKMRDMLADRVQRLSLKDIPFKSEQPLDEEEVLQMEEHIISYLDEDLELHKYQKKDLALKKSYEKFIRDHCRERHYIFQVRKCNDESCCPPKRNEDEVEWLPDPEIDESDKNHYKAYELLVGQDTSEKDRPSSLISTVAAVAEDQQGCKNAFLIAQNVRSTVVCYECHKPRCIYGKGKMTLRDQRGLKRLLEKHDYTCGSLITPDGTFIRGLETTATFDPQTEEFVVNTPNLSSIKWWPGSLGKTTNHTIVMAQLYTRGQHCGVYPIIVQIRSLDNHQPMPGVTVGDIGPKFGYSVVDNGFLKLDNVRVPRRNMLMKHAVIEKDGTFRKLAYDKLTYGSMVLVRTYIVLDMARSLSQACTIAIRYSAVRRQSKINPQDPEPQVLDYQTQQSKLFPHLARAYAFHLVATEMVSMFQRISRDVVKGDLENLPQLHALSAGLKAFTSLATAGGMEECRMACGGHGYAHTSGLPKIYADSVPAVTYEGEFTVMALQTARYLVKWCSNLHMGEKLPAFLSYLELSPNRKSSLNERLNEESLLDAFEYRAARLVFGSTQLITDRVRKGHTREEAWNLTSVELVKAAMAHCEAFMVRVFLQKLASPSLDGGVHRVLTTLYRLYCCSAINQHLGDYLVDGYLSTSQAKLLRERELTLMADLRPDAVALVDAFDIPDEILDSCIGRFDGNVYEAMYNYAKNSPLNETEVHHSYYEHLRPLIQAGKAQSKL